MNHGNGSQTPMEDSAEQVEVDAATEGGLPRGLVLRCALYIVAPAVLLEAYVLAAQRGYGKLLTQEHSALEQLQVACLLISSLLLHAAARRRADMRQLLAFLSLLPLVAVLRELDDVLEEWAFDDTWEALAGLLLLYLAYKVWRDFAALRRQAGAFACTRAFGFFLCGFITAMVFSRLMGQKVLWRAVLEGHQLYRGPKRIIEEWCEQLGYFMILFGAIEACVWARSRPPSSRGGEKGSAMKRHCAKSRAT